MNVFIGNARLSRLANLLVERRSVAACILVAFILAFVTAARVSAWGDVVHVAAIQFADPAVSVEYDTDPKQAEATRKAAFSRASQEGFWIGAAHISFPGLGHVGAREDRFVWIPAEYTTRLSSASAK